MRAQQVGKRKLKSYRGKGVRVVYDIVRERDDAPVNRRMRDARDVATFIRDMQQRGLVPQEREAFMVLALDARHGVIGFQVVSIGSLVSAQVHPREVYRFAVAAGAAAILVAHNHPSGDPAPSAEDRLVTERLRECGETLGVELLDHVVLGERTFYSFSADRIERLGAA